MLGLTHPVIDIAIVCSDFASSAHFYQDCLGLEVAADVQVSPAVASGAGLAPRGFRHLRLRAGNTLIKLMEIDCPPPPRSGEFAAGVRWLTFFVDDVALVAAQLRDKGVQLVALPIVAPDAAAVACVMDPDGLLIELVQVDAR
jgi:glyoxylase I family protein